MRPPIVTHHRWGVSVGGTVVSLTGANSPTPARRLRDQPRTTSPSAPGAQLSASAPAGRASSTSRHHPVGTSATTSADQFTTRPPTVSAISPWRATARRTVSASRHRLHRASAVNFSSTAATSFTSSRPPGTPSRGERRRRSTSSSPPGRVSATRGDASPTRPSRHQLGRPVAGVTTGASRWSSPAPGSPRHGGRLRLVRPQLHRQLSAGRSRPFAGRHGGQRRRHHRHHRWDSATSARPVTYEPAPSVSSSADGR